MRRWCTDCSVTHVIWWGCILILYSHWLLSEKLDPSIWVFIKHDIGSPSPSSWSSSCWLLLACLVSGWGGVEEEVGKRRKEYIILIPEGFCHPELAPDLPRDTIKLNVEILWLNYPVPEITHRDETWLRHTCSPVTDILGRCYQRPCHTATRLQVHTVTQPTVYAFCKIDQSDLF